MTDPAPWTTVVRRSHDRFVALTGDLSEEDVNRVSGADEWSVAQVASHLGSQAEIFELFLVAGLTGDPVPGGEVFGPIWDRWNAMAPLEQVRASNAANEAFVSRVEQLPADEADRFSLSMFGSEQDLAGLLRLRLGEHALHSWDAAVALDPEAVVAPDAVELLVDGLPDRVARSEPRADLAPVLVETSAPERTWLLVAHPAVALLAPDETSDKPAGEPLRLTAEAFLRLVNGRLGTGHTPAALTDDRLPDLRALFPAF